MTAEALAMEAPAAAEADLDVLKVIADLSPRQRAVMAGRYILDLRPIDIAKGNKTTLPDKDCCPGSLPETPVLLSLLFGSLSRQTLGDIRHQQAIGHTAHRRGSQQTTPNPESAAPGRGGVRASRGHGPAP
jgi:hypothetical protein